MRKMKLLLCAAVVLLLAACTTNAPSYDISAYMAAFEAMDYDAMWEQTLPREKIDKDAFIEKYDAIFSGLGVEAVVISGLSGPDADGGYTYTATYKTKDYGDFTNDYSLTAAAGKDGKGAVRWDFSLIFPEMETGSSVRISTLKASRGEIFAADGSLMASNSFADTVYMDTSKVQDIARVAAAAGVVTGLSDTKIVEMFNAAMEKGTRIVTLGAFFADELTEAQKESMLAVEGLGIDNKMYTPIRDYPLGASAAHMVGYTGYPDVPPAGYTEADKMGLSGLEAAYETQLKGKNGKIIYIEDKWGRSIRTLFETPMEEGQDLRLTIKPELQQGAYDALGTKLKEGQSGVVIVMDASTGFVEAMASYPSYDNNLFTFPLTEQTWDYLKAPESNQPLFSRATQGQYPPGSVFKPFTAAAALEAGAVTPDTEFDGVITEDNKWMPEEPGWEGQAITRVDNSGTPLKLYNAMVKSDNIYFAFAALRLGADEFTRFMERIGLEQAVPFELPVKEANLVNASSVMTRNRLAHTGYGQGELLVTPLQLSSMYTAFANGTGDMMQPVLVEKTCRTDGLEYNTLSQTAPSVWIEEAVKKRTLDILTPMLQDVVEHGTGKPARIKGVTIGGKTGTAEIGDDKSREISWFAGYWMDGYYDRLVIVMVDVATEEGPVKFEIAKEMLMP